LQTTIRLTDEFNEELRVAMARRRVKSLQAAVEEALRMWMDQDASGGAAKASPLASAAPRVWDDVAAFYAEADPALVKIVRDIVAAHKQMRRRQQQAATKAG